MNHAKPGKPNQPKQSERNVTHAQKRLPLTLVTGFLGSGKTTCLEHIARDHAGMSLLFVVNEFGQVDVDGRRLAQTLDQVEPIPGGSIFCKCLVSTFIEKMQAVADRADALALDAVIVEASGMADPGVVDRMLPETGLGDRFELVQVVTLVDPGNFAKLLATLPNLTSQVKAADVIAINKADCHDDSQLQAIEDQVRQLNPNAKLERTTHGQLSLDVTGAGRTTQAQGEYAKCADPNYATTVLRFRQPVPVTTVSGLVRAVGDDLFRAKGAVRTTDGPLAIEFSASGLSHEPTKMGEGQASELVLIAHGRSRGRLLAATARLAGVAVAV